MADPLSIVGTTAGLLSLGIQVYGGIKEYLGAIQTRDEDLEGVRRHASLLKDSLAAIEKGIQSTAIHEQPSIPSVVFCLQSCKTELNSLRIFLFELGYPPATPSTSLRATISEGKKKLVYPFKRGTITKLEDRLRNVNGILHTALQSLGMNVLSELHEMVADHKGKSDVLMGNIVTLQSETSMISTSVCSIQQTVPSIMKGVQHLGPLMETQVSSLSSRMDQTYEAVQSNFSGLGDRIEASSQSQRFQLDRIEARMAQKEQEDARLRRVEEILANLQLTDPCTRQQNYTSNIAVGRLVAKPNHLKLLCDDFDSERDCFPSITQSQHSVTRTLKRRAGNCQCSAYRHRKRSYIKWGPLALFHYRDTMATSCQCSEYALQESHRRVGGTYLGSGTLLKRAIQITFLMKRGAGGASMNANLSFCNVVDEQKSPVFRLLRLVIHALISKPKLTRWKSGDVERLFKECRLNIGHLYRFRKSRAKRYNITRRIYFTSCRFLGSCGSLPLW
ncbi:hypothetical protein ONS96_007672 [Cadophora gregata f. sp. sojae]|nr:hypothetical protein ONS96_007672 [Cadophora gregata f. sp. sojae]